ncbi:hypothetical protein MAP00_004171 [Monascus purpureus]|nr:hypothetical protein MAP00_004171 [Monascus purpureus]
MTMTSPLSLMTRFQNSTRRLLIRRDKGIYAGCAASLTDCKVPVIPPLSSSASSDITACTGHWERPKPNATQNGPSQCPI